MSKQQSASEGFSYTIKPGDTLYQLAQKYNLPVQDIIEANPEIAPRNLQLGQEIWIPIKKITDTCLLLLTPNAQSQTPNASGLLWLNRNNQQVQLLVAVLGLPKPAELNATGYQATFTWERTTSPLSLTKTTVAGLNEIWLGGTTQSFPPEFFSGSIDIYPDPMPVGPPLLGGLIEDCN